MAVAGKPSDGMSHAIRLASIIFDDLSVTAVEALTMVLSASDVTIEETSEETTPLPTDMESLMKDVIEAYKSDPDMIEIVKSINK